MRNPYDHLGAHQAEVHKRHDPLTQGYGLRQEVLPAGRYWTRQEPATKEMDREHVRLLEDGKPDIVIVGVESRATLMGYPHGRILHYGYERILRTNYDGVYRAVYKKNVKW